jgi:hypothetical protein
LKKNGSEKLKPRFYGPYKVIRRVGEVAYELELSKGSRIHNTYHASCLKKILGQQVTASTNLPPLDEEGQLVLAPERIVDVRERRLRSRDIREQSCKNHQKIEEIAIRRRKQEIEKKIAKKIEKKRKSTRKNRQIKKCTGLSYPPRFFWVLFDI